MTMALINTIFIIMYGVKIITALTLTWACARGSFDKVLWNFPGQSQVCRHEAPAPTTQAIWFQHKMDVMKRWFTCHGGNNYYEDAAKLWTRSMRFTNPKLGGVGIGSLSHWYSAPCLLSRRCWGSNRYTLRERGTIIFLWVRVSIMSSVYTTTIILACSWLVIINSLGH